MNADGSHIETLATEPPDPTYAYRSTYPYMPFWLNNTQIVFQSPIASTTNDLLELCNVYAPFLFDVNTSKQTPLFDRHTMRVGNSSRGRYGSCGYGNSRNEAFSPQNPSALHPIFKSLEERRFLAHAMSILGNDARLSPSGRSFAMSQVLLYSSFGPSQIKIYEDGQWRTVLNVHSKVVSWSPDEKYLIYDAYRFDKKAMWVIAITSVDGTFTYPLIGNDGVNYFSPSWRP